MRTDLRTPASERERQLERRLCLLLNRFWRGARLLWISDGSRVYEIEHGETPAILKIFVPMEIGRNRLEPQSDVQARYERELKAARDFSNSSYGLPVLDARILADIPFMIVPFVHGQSLEEALLDSGAADDEDRITRGIDLLRQLALALHDLHEAGHVHGDIKPGNILIERDHLWLIDFGCSRPIGSPSKGGPVYYSVGYTAPESLEGEGEVSMQADLFAFGMIAHEVLGEGNPFTQWRPRERAGEDALELYIELLQKETIPLLPTVPGLSARARAAIERCLCIDPRLRPTSSLQVAQALSARDGAPEPARTAA